MHSLLAFLNRYLSLDPPQMQTTNRRLEHQAPFPALAREAADEYRYIHCRLHGPHTPRCHEELMPPETPKYAPKCEWLQVEMPQFSEKNSRIPSLGHE